MTVQSFAIFLRLLSGAVLVSAFFWLISARFITAEGSSEPTWPRTFVFDSSQSSATAKIPLSEIDSSFPRDWSGFEALVIEFKSSSPQRLNLKVHRGPAAGSDREFSRILFHPYPGVWVRAAVPLSMLAQPPSTGHDMASVGNRARTGYFLSLWGPFVRLDDVTALEFEMIDPIGSPTLEIRSITLAEKSPGDAVLDGLPVMDRFGQYAHGQWSGKASALERLQADWRKEEESLQAGEFGYCAFGGYRNTHARATGFFRVEQIDGKWWFVDPDGHLFLSVGADVIRPDMATPTSGREELFETMPPDSTAEDGRRASGSAASFLTWNIQRRFGDGWVQKWVDMTLGRMESWGLNTIANWSDSRLWDAKRKPYVIPLRGWQTEVSYLGLPDVHSEEFVRLADERAREQCAERRDDPWLIGYFLANEPPFTQKQLQTAEMILAGPETATKAALLKWLEGEDSAERRREFIDRAFERYVEVTSAAVRRHDPNHLNLGMRGGGRPTAAEIHAARAFDVYSVNIYSEVVSKERVQQVAELTGKPILIGEFHFGTPGRGLSAGLVQVRDEAERGVAYRRYVEQAFAMPELIGVHWFQWADQPATGRFDGENYNIGLVDVTDRPYVELVEAMKRTHRRIYAVHAAELEPYATHAAIR